MINSVELKEYWTKNYPEAIPRPAELRDIYPNRWLRIHTLPDSKRYPTSEDEYQEILFRHNTILENLIGSAGNKNIVLLTRGYGEPGNFTNEENVFEIGLDEDNSSLFWVITDEDEDTNDEPGFSHLPIFMSNYIWRPGLFDQLFRKTADWIVANILLVGIEGKFLYLPYDGGADIIISSQEQRDQLKIKYANWLSKHPMGL